MLRSCAAKPLLLASLRACTSCCHATVVTEGESQGAARADAAFDPDPAIMELDEHPRQRQAEAGALLSPERSRSDGTPRRGGPASRARSPVRCVADSNVLLALERWALMSMRSPSGVNVTAFQSRLEMTWRIFRASPSIVPSRSSQLTESVVL